MAERGARARANYARLAEKARRPTGRARKTPMPHYSVAISMQSWASVACVFCQAAAKYACLTEKHW
eukprot:15436489-Alexandrium_andersonii.AAC.1